MTAIHMSKPNSPGKHYSIRQSATSGYRNKPLPKQTNNQERNQKTNKHYASPNQNQHRQDAANHHSPTILSIADAGIGSCAVPSGTTHWDKRCPAGDVFRCCHRNPC
jgi:hypothetical protein